MTVDLEYKEIYYYREKMQFIYAWERAFNRKLQVETADWLFGLNSRNRIFVASTSSGNIAGGYCLIEQTAFHNGRAVRSLLCNNVFTVPEYRSFNIFVRLGRFALNLVREKDTIGLGFPNELALGGHKRVGWEFCNPIPFFERSPSTNEVDPSYSFVDVFSEDLFEIADFCERVKNKYEFFIIKDIEYLSWRYFQRPQLQRKYFMKILKKDDRILGYAVLSHYSLENNLHIVDIASQDDFEFEEMLLRIYNIGFYLKVKLINIWGSPGFVPILEKQNFILSKNKTHLIVKDLSLDQQKGVSQSLRHHHLVLGDNDVF